MICFAGPRYLTDSTYLVCPKVGLAGPGQLRLPATERSVSSTKVIITGPQDSGNLCEIKGPEIPIELPPRRMVPLRVTAVITTLCRDSLRLTLEGLAGQSRKPDEVLVVHSCDGARLNRLVEGFDRALNVQAVPQRGVGVPGAVNTAIEELEGDLALFIDDDAVPPEGWVRRYAELLWRLGGGYAGASSRDVLFTPGSALVSGPDDEPVVRLYRWLLAPLVRRPHPKLRDYRLGVYVDSRYLVAHGPCIPYMRCLSLPFRGANMAFRTDALEELRLPESRAWARGRGYEQYLGAALVLRGYRYAYVPDNPVLHLAHEGVSRGPRDRLEESLLRCFLHEILGSPEHS